MATHAVITVDTDGVVTGWDDGAETLIGHPARMLSGCGSTSSSSSRFERAMRQPEVKDLAADLPVLCADGTVREFAGRLLALSDGLGVAIGAIAIYADAGTTGLRPVLAAAVITYGWKASRIQILPWPARRVVAQRWRMPQ